MIAISRRTVLAGTAGAGLLAAAPAIARAAPADPALFVFDARFAQSQRAARSEAARSVRVLDPRDEDLGVAWRQAIPERLHQHGGVIAGMTMWSDQFICESFARDFGLRLQSSSAVLDERGQPTGLHHWVLA